MKKVLILAYDFPPNNSIGAKRPYSWYKFLHNYNWHPIVSTRHWNYNIKNPVDYIRETTIDKTIIQEDNHGTIIQSKYTPNLRDRLIIKYGTDKFSLLRKTLTLSLLISDFILPPFDNRRNIYREAEKFLKKHQVDVIIATGEPFVLFKYAFALSKKFNTPWIADYRDGWTNNYSLENLPTIEKFLRKTLFKRIEKKFIKKTSAILTVSDYLKDSLNKTLEKDISLIRNGYDYSNTNPTNQNKSIFTISYSGTLYPHQRLDVFLAGFKLFVEKHTPNIQIKFLGANFYSSQKNRILNYNNTINKYITTTDRLDKKEYFKTLEESNLLLLLANENIDGSCAKVYDYLAVKRRILLCVNDFKTLESTLKTTNSGIICNTPDEVLKSLEESYKEWQLKGQVYCNSKNFEQYSRKEQTKKLAEILNSIVKT